jgi:hypothetical protein
VVCLTKLSVNLDQDITASEMVAEEMNWQDIEGRGICLY